MKGFSCPDWVASLGDSYRSTAVVDSWLSQHLLFETDAPAGAALNNPFNFFTIANMPQSILLDNRQDNNIPTPNPSAGRQVQFWGLDDAKTWYYTIDDGPTVPVYPCEAEDCYLNVQNDATFTNLTAHITVPVFVGDVVSIWTYSSHTPHGLLFWLNAIPDAELGVASDISRFFDVTSVWNPAPILDNRNFPATESDYFYGEQTSVIGSHLLFSGTVKPSAIGSDEYGAPAPFDPVFGKSNHMELYFTDYVYGPAAMTVRLHAISSATHFLNSK